MCDRRGGRATEGVDVRQNKGGDGPCNRRGERATEARESHGKIGLGEGGTLSKGMDVMSKGMDFVCVDGMSVLCEALLLQYL